LVPDTVVGQAGVRRKPVLEREDVEAIFAVLFDIKRLLIEIVVQLGGEDEEEDEAGAGS
jgi:hypothetical protein